MTRYIRGTLTLTSWIFAYITIFAIVLYKLYTIAIRKHPRSFLTKNYVRIVASIFELTEQLLFI